MVAVPPRRNTVAATRISSGTASDTRSSVDAVYGSRLLSSSVKIASFAARASRVVQRTVLSLVVGRSTHTGDSVLLVSKQAP